MPKSWNDVIKDPRFPKDRESILEARDMYFNDVVVPRVESSLQDQARQEFYTYTEKVTPQLKTAPVQKGSGASGSWSDPKSGTWEIGQTEEQPYVRANNKDVNYKEFYGLDKPEAEREKGYIEKAYESGELREDVESNVLDDPVFMAVFGGTMAARGAIQAGHGILQIARQTAAGAADEALYNVPSLSKMATRGVIKGAGKVKNAITKPSQQVKSIIQNSDPVTKQVAKETERQLELFADPTDYFTKVAKGQDPLLKNFEKSAPGAIPKETESMSTIRNLGNDILNDYEKTGKLLSKKAAREGFSAPEIAAMNETAKKGLDDYIGVIQSGAYDEAIHKSFTENIFQHTAYARSESGKALRTIQDAVAPQRVAAALNKLPRMLNKREQTELVNLMKSGAIHDNPQQVKMFIDQLGDPKAEDYVFDWWYNSILSGIPTHIVNSASNTMWYSFQAPHQLARAGIDKFISMFRGGKRDYLLNEAIPSWAGIKSGMKKGAERIGKIRRGESVQELDKFTVDVGGSVLGALERSPNKMVRQIGKYYTIPTKFLRGMDVWFKSIAFDDHVYRYMRGKNITDPNLVPKEVMEEAKQFADYVTFMDEPGNITKVINQLRNPDVVGRPVAAGMKFILPFVNTPGHLLKRGIEMTPGLGLTLARGQKPAEVIAKQLEGLVIGGSLLAAAESGAIDLIGAAPQGEAEREAFYRMGKQPWSIGVTVNGKKNYYSYRRVEPFNTVLASVAMAREEINNAPDDRSAQESFVRVAHSIKDNLIDGSYMQGLQQIFNRHGSAGDIVQRTVASMLPWSSFGRSINRSIEAAIEGEATVRESESLKDAVAQVVPGGYELAKPRIGVFGDEQKFQGGWFRQFLPYKMGTEDGSNVDRVLTELDVFPGKPGDKLTVRGKKYTIPEDLYETYQKELGHDMKKYLDRIVERRGFDRMSNERKKKMIESVISRVRARHRNMLKNEVIFRHYNDRL